MYTSYVVTILSSMSMGYFNLARLDSIPHIKVLLQAIINMHQKGCDHTRGIIHCSICQCLNHQKTVIIIWLFDCLIALEAKFHICEESDFIMHFMTCMLKHITTTMQTFTRVIGSICSCLVIGSFKS